ADHPRRMTGECDCLWYFEEGELATPMNITCTRLENLVVGTLGLRQHASISLNAHGKPLGVLNVASTDWGDLSDEDLQLLYLVGDLVGIAIERARLFDNSVELGAVKERNRLAREIHDTLAQGFVGIGLQLKAVERALERDPKSARQHLELARDMVKHSIAEARRTVWNLRSHALETSDLVTVLSDTARRMTEETDVKAEVRIEGTPRPLPEDVENNILRLCQEALTNAMKHAEAKQVSIELRFDADSVRLRVKDDGRGFDALAPLSARDGHFGLTGMRERVEQMRGRFSIDSRPNEGTLIEAAIPVADARR
ncbi:MAG TPA: GAF domain-containing sensor histidine kinase, partial [Blastocatellia bacterium]|nr:GAF domain-containing sensor histidine kinase [Blastocatellia bacterium]